MPVNLTAYAEYGAIGVIILLFIGMIKFLQTSLIAKLSSVEVICIKLIDRWNRSDEVRERRYEQLIEQINRVTDDLNYLKGRIKND
jgi:hypothetical protein